MAPGIAELIRRYGIDPKRSLGQNFLADSVHLDRIVEIAPVGATDTVLEIGPGLGTLTARLAARAGRVLAVELDNRLIDLLREVFADRPHVKIVHGDILELDPAATLAAEFPELPQPLVYHVVANLPYYITSAVLRHLLESEQPPVSAVVMVQREVAERICAKPGDMSILAVSVQFYAEPRLMHHVPAGAFYPAPKVDSAVLRLDIRPTPLLPGVDPTRFFAIVRAGFSQKRKQLANSLSGGLHLSKAAAQQALIAAGIDPATRAERLDLAAWGRLYATLPPR
jgi:16S rRNA (adenine1518-N6/adenine1519-N6)-dimethyltransferase